MRRISFLADQGRGWDADIGRMLLVFIALLPLVNALFDFLSLGITRFAPLNRMMIDWLDRREKTDDALWGVLVSIALPLQLVFFTGVAIIGLVYAAQYIGVYYPAFGYYFLWFFEWFAQSIGAAVEPTPVQTRILMAA